MGGTNGHNGNGHLNGKKKPRQPGKGEGTPATPTLDMNNVKDVKTLRRAVVHGWPVKPEDMAYYYDRLKDAIAAADNPRDITNCVKTYTTIIGQVQVQEHHDIKNARIDEGQGTELVVTYAKSKDNARFDADYA